MQFTTKQNGKEMMVECLTIDECVQKRYLTKQEGVEHHDWHKGVSGPVDEKHFIYVDGIYAGVSETTPTKGQILEIAKDTLGFLS